MGSKLLKKSAELSTMLARELVEKGFEHGKIKEIIISRRKQELLVNLHRDILNDALNNNKLKIIEEDDKVSK